MHLCPFSKSKFSLYMKHSLTVSTFLHRLVLSISSYVQYKMGLERLTRLGYSNVLRLSTVIWYMHYHSIFACLKDCMFVFCLYPINVKTAETIRPRFVVDLTWPQGRENVADRGSIKSKNRRWVMFTCNSCCILIIIWIWLFFKHKSHSHHIKYKICNFILSHNVKSIL